MFVVGIIYFIHSCALFVWPILDWNFSHFCPSFLSFQAGDPKEDLEDELFMSRAANQSLRVHSFILPLCNMEKGREIGEKLALLWHDSKSSASLSNVTLEFAHLSATRMLLRKMALNFKGPTNLPLCATVIRALAHKHKQTLDLVHTLLVAAHSELLTLKYLSFCAHFMACSPTNWAPFFSLGPPPLFQPNREGEK